MDFIYIYGMASNRQDELYALKRDRVNRVPGLVYLPIDGSRMHKGMVVSRDNLYIEEQPIDCYVRDAMAMREPVSGNAVGDAVFFATDTENVFDASMPYGYGSIAIHKFVTGTGFNPDQLFKVSIDFNGVTIKYVINGVEYEGSVCVLELKSSQMVVLESIPGGTRYNVTEDTAFLPDGYSLDSIDNSSGEVITSSNVRVQVNNRYVRPVYYGGISVSVSVGGTGFDTNKVFKVVVKFSEPVNYSVDGGTPIGTSSNVYIARLKSGETVNLGHVQEGVTYVVAAVPLSPSEITEGYALSGVTGGSGTVVRDIVSQVLVNYGYYGSTGSLIVTAIVDNPDPDKVLHIAITFSRIVNYSVNGGSLLTNGSSVYMAELRHNESVTLSDIFNGTTYAVTPSITESEQHNGYAPDITDGSYPRSGVISSVNSPARVVVKFTKTQV